MIYIGNPDFLLLKGKNRQKEDAICYICQSFVEEVRLAPSALDAFMKLMKESANGKKIYIKTHPMTDLKFYKSIISYENVEFTKDFPICKKYIGHYSSLLAVAKQVSDDILIWDFTNHHLPPFFLRFGSIITDKKEDLFAFINGNEGYKNNLHDENIIKLTQNQIDALVPPMSIVADTISRL